MNGFIKLRILGQGMNLQNISRKLKRPPSFTYKKGDIFVDKIIKGQPVIYQEDCWLLEVEKEESEIFEECIEKFVLSFCNVDKHLKSLASKFDVVFWISAYPDDEQAQINLSDDVVSALGKMGASIRIDIAFLKEFYEGRRI